MNMVKTVILAVGLCFQGMALAETISDFNPPLWNFGTGVGADASGTGTLDGVPFAMTFDVNTGTKLFTSTNQHTSNATLGHGGSAGSLLLGGNGENLTITFDSPITVTLGLSHVNILTDGWDLITPADRVMDLHANHEITGTVGNITGLRQNSGIPGVTDPESTSYFTWYNVTTIQLRTVGVVSTTIALSSMATARPVPTLSQWAVGLLLLLMMVMGVMRVHRSA